MNNFFSLVLFIPVYLIGVMITVGSYIFDIQIKDYEQWRLETVSNYCTDAAIDQMLASEDLEMDYVNLSDFTSDPTMAMDEFSSLFCVNYKMPPTDFNRQLIRNTYLKLFYVLTYDGYYKFQPYDKEIAYTPKIPYTYSLVDESGTKVYYALTLGKSTAYLYRDGGYYKTTNPFSDEFTSYVISSRISDDMMSDLDSQYRQGVYATPYIPGEMSELKGTNTILGPTVMVFIDGFDLEGAHTIQDFSIGASAAKLGKGVICYERGGRKQYCFHDTLYRALKAQGVVSNIDEFEDWIAGLKGGTGALDIYLTSDEAAANGYYYDNLYGQY